jgi:hypothetical protein
MALPTGIGPKQTLAPNFRRASGGPTAKFGKGAPASVADLANYADGRADNSLIDVLMKHKDGKNGEPSEWSEDQVMNALAAGVPKGRIDGVRSEAFKNDTAPFILDNAPYIAIIVKRSGQEPWAAVFDKKTGEGVGLKVGFVGRSPQQLKHEYGKFLRFVGLDAE